MPSRTSQNGLRTNITAQHDALEKSVRRPTPYPPPTEGVKKVPLPRKRGREGFAVPRKRERKNAIKKLSE